MEKTLLIIKPDGVEHRLIGRILTRFEESGLEITKICVAKATREQILNHYPTSESWFEAVGNKTLSTCAKYAIDPINQFGTDNPIDIGKIVKEWLVDYMTQGKVVPFVVEGYHAVEKARLMVGNTMPLAALPGTIRGDFGLDSADIANSGKRAVRNLIHASESVEDAEREIHIWF